MQGRQVDLADLQSKLMGWLQKKMPQARKLSISGMERSGSGISSESFLFDLSWQEAAQQRSEGMVLRCAPRTFPVFPEYDLGKQFRIMKALQGTNVPVPKVHWLERDPKLLGVPFYLMGKIDGVILPDYPPHHCFGPYYDATPKQRVKMWWGCLEAIANIHKLDWKGLGLSFLGIPKGDTDPLDRELDYWEGFLNWAMKEPGEPQPILRAALKWLKENRYIPEHVVLCWGDSRMGNTIYSRGHFDVLAILDWEMAYLGDPEADLAFFLFADWCVAEYLGIPRVEGTPSREETVRRYEELTGWKVTDLFYNDVFAALRIGVITAKSSKNFKKLGVVYAAQDMETDNMATQRLASLLDLPAPGTPPRQMTRIEDVTVTVQFHLTGPSGSDWYLVSDKGEASRHEGTVRNPNVTMTVSAEDWAAIQRGEMVLFHAWAAGKLKIEGDTILWMQLTDVISKLGR